MESTCLMCHYHTQGQITYSYGTYCSLVTTMGGVLSYCPPAYKFTADLVALEAASPVLPSYHMMLRSPPWGPGRGLSALSPIDSWFCFS